MNVYMNGNVNLFIADDRFKVNIDVNDDVDVNIDVYVIVDVSVDVDVNVNINVDDNDDVDANDDVDVDVNADVDEKIITEFLAPTTIPTIIPKGRFWLFESTLSIFNNNIII